jgi:hypothetical protein
MSVILYSCDGSNYYSLYNWNTWQKIDRPSESKIPDYDEETCNRLLFDEHSTKTRRTLAPNRIEDNKNIKEEKKKEFIAPSFEEIEKYVAEKNLKVDAKKFFDYFTEGNWIDSKGNKVKNWKQKILTWNGYSKDEIKASTSNTYHAQDNQYTDLSKFYLN